MDNIHPDKCEYVFVSRRAEECCSRTNVKAKATTTSTGRIAEHSIDNEKLVSKEV